MATRATIISSTERTSACSPTAVRTTTPVYGGYDGPAHIFGDGGDDTLIGTNVGNIIEGGSDNDVIFGLAGNDVLFGNAGEDDLHGYEGNDLLFGGRGTDALAGGDGRDLLEGGRDLYTDILSGEYLNGLADHDSDIYVAHDSENETGRYLESNDSIAVFDLDLENEYRARPEQVWQLLLGGTSSGFIVDVGLSFEFEAQDHNISVVEPDWKNEIAPVNDYFADLNDALVESAEDDTSWAEEAHQDTINDAALLALLAEASPSLEESDPATEESDLLEFDEALEIESLFAEAPEILENEILDCDLSLLESDLPAKVEPAAETIEELYVYESNTPSWSSQYVVQSWAKFRW